LRPGGIADVSILHDERGRFRLRDNEQTEVIAESLLRPAFACVATALRGRRDPAEAIAA